MGFRAMIYLHTTAALIKHDASLQVIEWHERTVVEILMLDLGDLLG